ncbi:MAG TPA: hypothetical protein VGM60_19320, partial [Pseudonocardia sp.]|uniref:hypothetical protein n=1 Tax=Pseudonocardia sp. TaxID=60912 RepID=UPI002F41EF98
IDVGPEQWAEASAFMGADQVVERRDLEHGLQQQSVEVFSALILIMPKQLGVLRTAGPSLLTIQF